MITTWPAGAFNKVGDGKDCIEDTDGDEEDCWYTVLLPYRVVRPVQPSYIDSYGRRLALIDG